MGKTFRSWDPEQRLLLPPAVDEFVPAGHLAHFVRDLVREELDLVAIVDTYTEERGYPPYDPVMMTALLLYAYAQGLYASRRIARACEERVDFLAVTAMNRPDFRTISDFRKRHLTALQGLFVQVLRLCARAGLVRLGHVALDGTKVKANASKHKAMSYGRMKQAEARLAAEVAGWLAQAEAADAAASPPPAATTPPDKAQRNFTDPESRIMKGPDGFVQAYNAQLGVDAGSHVIVAQLVTNAGTDSAHFDPLLAQVKVNTGRQAAEVSADAGYCSEANLQAADRRHVRAYIATGRQRHGTASVTRPGRGPGGTLVAAMRRRLQRGGWRSRYRLRKGTVEPVFGIIKHARSFRQFLLRGLKQVRGEWSLVCAAYNVQLLAKAMA